MSDTAGQGNRTQHAQLRTLRRTAPRQELPIPPSRLRATCLRWASRVPTSLATSRLRTTRRIRPERPHRRRSAPYRGTSRIQPCARRQSTCALCPPRHFSPCSSDPVRFTPLRGITSKATAGITSRPCRYSTPGPRLRGTQPYAGALLGTLPAGRPPPRAITGSRSHTTPLPRRRSPTPAVHKLRADPDAPISPPTCRSIWDRHHLRLANPLHHSLGRPRHGRPTTLRGSGLLCDQNRCRRTWHPPQDAQLRPGIVGPPLPPASPPPSPPTLGHPKHPVPMSQVLAPRPARQPWPVPSSRRLPPHPARQPWPIPTSLRILPLTTLLQQTAPTRPPPRPLSPAVRPPPRRLAVNPPHLRPRAPGRRLRRTASAQARVVASLKQPRLTHA